MIRNKNICYNENYKFVYIFKEVNYGKIKTGFMEWLWGEF